VGRTAKQVPGFRGRSGRTFKAKLKLEQDAEGKWRVDFDEDWAKEPPKEQEETPSGDGGTPSGEGDGSAPARARSSDGRRRSRARAR
jgi:DNA topoisomerase-3